MTNRIRTAVLLLLLAVAISLGGIAARAQATPHAENTSAPELALAYTWAHSNAPPSGCGCFSLNGGSASFAVPIKHGAWSVAGDITLTHAGNISAAGYDLDLSIFTAGIRYRPALRSSSWQPYAQVLAGPAYSSGSFVLAQHAVGISGSDAFAANLGGGIDYRLNRRFALRLAEADYLLTTFDNGSNNHQNNFRVSCGVVLRLGR